MTLRCTSNSKLSARLAVTDSEWICSHFKHGNCIRCFFSPKTGCYFSGLRSAAETMTAGYSRGMIEKDN